MPLNFDFLGNCHNFAIALHELSSKPLCLLYGERIIEQDSLKSTEHILIHAGIIFDGNFYDETGNQGPPDELLRTFKFHNPDYHYTKIINFNHINSEFYKVLNDTGAIVSPELIKKFKEWIKDKQESEMFPFLEKY